MGSTRGSFSASPRKYPHVLLKQAEKGADTEARNVLGNIFQMGRRLRAPYPALAPIRLGYSHDLIGSSEHLPNRFDAPIHEALIVGRADAPDVED